jgi:hypothetical protein
MKKKFFHLLDLSIFKSFILLTSSGSKFSHWNFISAFVRDLIQKRVPWPQTTQSGRPNTSTAELTWLDLQQNNDPQKKDELGSAWVCFMKNRETHTKFKCAKCNVRLCADPCFEVYHTESDFWRLWDAMRGEAEHSL